MKIYYLKNEKLILKKTIAKVVNYNYVELTFINIDEMLYKL